MSFYYIFFWGGGCLFVCCCLFGVGGGYLIIINSNYLGSTYRSNHTISCYWTLVLLCSFKMLFMEILFFQSFVCVFGGGCNWKKCKNKCKRRSIKGFLSSLDFIAQCVVCHRYIYSRLYNATFTSSIVDRDNVPTFRK